MRFRTAQRPSGVTDRHSCPCYSDSVYGTRRLGIIPCERPEADDHDHSTSTAIRQGGDAESQFRLGYRIAFGRRRARRTRWSAAIRLWRSAASSGHARAAFFLGTCYDLGRGVARDVPAAARWDPAARRILGHEVAMYNLALCYRDGEGVRRSARLAARWSARSSDLSRADAIRDLGVACHEGRGVRKDDVMAVCALQACAARQSDVKAMYNLGLCYAHGHGVTRSARQADQWFRKAAQRGHRAGTRPPFRPHGMTVPDRPSPRRPAAGRESRCAVSQATAPCRRSTTKDVMRLNLLQLLGVLLLAAVGCDRSLTFDAQGVAHGTGEKVHHYSVRRPEAARGVRGREARPQPLVQAGRRARSRKRSGPTAPARASTSARTARSAPGCGTSRAPRKARRRSTTRPGNVTKVVQYRGGQRVGGE